MDELPLTKQDSDLLITALELLLQRTGDRGASAAQSSIKSLIGRLEKLHGDERAQVIATIQEVLGEIAAELESNGPNADRLTQD